MKILRIGAIALAVLVAAIVALPFLVDANAYRPTLESTLSQSLGREVKIGDLKLSILSGGVTAGSLSIAEDPAYGKTPFVQAKSLKVGVELVPLILSRKLNVTGVTIDHPEVRLIQSATGAWNFSSLGGKTAPPPKPADPSASGKGPDLSVKLVKIAEGRFAFGKLVLEAVNLELRDFSASSSSPFSLTCKAVGGGDLQLNGQAGPIPQENLEATPFNAALKIAGLPLANTGSGISGISNFDGTAVSDGKSVKIGGKLKADKLQFAKDGKPADRPVELAFALDHNVTTRSGRLSQGDIRIGSAAASLTGTYAAQDAATMLRMQLSGPGMPVPELAAMLPPLGIVLPAGSSLQGGTASVKLAMEGPSTGLVTTGSIGLDKTRLTGFDLGGKMAVIQAIAGIKSIPDTEIQTLSTNLRMAPDGIRADAIRMIVPAIGELSGAGTVSPSNELDFRMAAVVQTSGILAAVRGEPIPFTVSGPASDPIFRPDVKSVVSDKAKSVGTKAAQGLLNRFLGGKKQ